MHKIEYPLALLIVILLIILSHPSFLILVFIICLCLPLPNLIVLQYAEIEKVVKRSLIGRFIRKRSIHKEISIRYLSGARSKLTSLEYVVEFPLYLHHASSLRLAERTDNIIEGINVVLISTTTEMIVVIGGDSACAHRGTVSPYLVLVMSEKPSEWRMHSHISLMSHSQMVVQEGLQLQPVLNRYGVTWKILNLLQQMQIHIQIQN